ncbi:CopG family transcriptional regulator [Rhizobium sp. PP-CC-3G-465]|uniref:CopG family transcriptional regulator n=1 Tax=Rhizobium sp. PP-CC-3G-465 TaxID=2135648 RepID=UPI001053A10E
MTDVVRYKDLSDVENVMPRTARIDEDLVDAVEGMAAREKKTFDEIVSDLVRGSLERSPTGVERNGFPILPYTPGTPVTTLEMVNALRDEEV